MLKRPQAPPYTSYSLLQNLENHSPRSGDMRSFTRAHMLLLLLLLKLLLLLLPLRVLLVQLFTRS